jgi:hypothetical protein
VVVKIILVVVVQLIKGLEMGWKKKLTRKERKHLKEDAEIDTLNQLKLTIKDHKERRKTAKIEPCYICKEIARKLKLL